MSLVALLTLLAQVATAQQTYTSVAGPWWFTLSGKDKGSIVMEFTAPKRAVFAVADPALTEHPSFGFSSSLEAFFQIAAGQQLSLDSNGNVFGTLELSDPNDSSGAPIGALTMEKGEPSSMFTKLKLKGTIANSDGTILVALKLTGVRPPNAFPVLTGRTTGGSLKGKGVKSKALDLSVLTDEVLGLPAYAFSGQGPVEINKAQKPAASLDGHIMLAPSFKAQGLLEASSDFGTGPVNGKLSLPDPNTAIPKVSLTAQADPRLQLKGTLTEAVEPILQVTPRSFDFGAVRLDASPTHTFSVQNLGIDTLSGSVAFVAGRDPDFQLTGETTYTDLAAGDLPVEIEVTFHPAMTGARSASLRFSIAGGVGAQVVPLSGTGGAAEISVDPDPIAFPSTAVGTPIPSTVTVTNTGDAMLTGNATMSTSVGSATVFTLLTIPGTIPQTSISYSLAPGAQTQFSVRFKPTAAGPVTGTLNLSGAAAGPKTVALSGTGS